MAFKTSHTQNNQYDGAIMFFVIVKLVHPDTYSVWLDTKKNMETTRMPNLNNDIPKDNLQIVEWMNNISIYGEIYSETARQKFNL